MNTGNHHRMHGRSSTLAAAALLLATLKAGDAYAQAQREEDKGENAVAATEAQGQVPPPAEGLPVNPQAEPVAGAEERPAEARLNGAPRSAPAATATATQAVPTWFEHLNIGGGAILWFYSPVDVAGAKNNVDLFFANLLLDGKFGAFGLHIEPRFRDSRLRAFFPGPVWAQEVYVSAQLASNTVLKVGKAYSHFGLFWDNSFYGNVQVYDGLKLDPDYGLSLEGALRPQESTGLRYWAQFFIVDGQTNVSLAGRDTISIPGARRRNQAILRLEPFSKIGEHVAFTGGLSGAYLQADLPSVGKKNVFRGAVDVSVAVRNWSAWAEFTHQSGQTVTDHPIAGVPATATTPAVAGRASASNNYALAGTQVAFGPVTVRYNVSTGRYEDLSITEWMHVPAIAWAAGNNLTVLGEYVNWRRYAPGASSALVDRSANITLNGHF
jgi:hypothetical protein